jgi:DNA recombination protein RmuC
MQRIDRGLETARNAYQDAFGKLASGKGNLIRRTEILKELGAKTNKDLPKELMDHD